VQIATTLTIAGVTGSVRISGNWSGEFVSNTVNIQSVTGSVTLTGGTALIAYGNVTLMQCRDVRFDADVYVFQIKTLLMLASAVVLQGQGAARHEYTQTNIRFNSRLEIHSNLEANAVEINLAAPADRHGFVIDYRSPARRLETYARKEAVGANYSGTAPSQPHVGMLWATPDAELSVW